MNLSKVIPVHTYVLLQDGRPGTQLPVRLEFPVTTFLSGKTASRATFTDLLSSGQLSARSSFTLPDCPWDFSEVQISPQCKMYIV